MTTLRLVGWQKGLQTVSLTQALMQYAGYPLSEAKRLIEQLLDGQVITITFDSEDRRAEFRTVAESLGALVG